MSQIIEDVTMIRSVSKGGGHGLNYYASVCFMADDFAGMCVHHSINYSGVTLKIALKNADPIYINAEVGDTDLLEQARKRIMDKVKAAKGIVDEST